jgi:hypothetical protein
MASITMGPPEIIDWDALEKQFGGDDGRQHEPYPVDHLVGRVALEDCVTGLEARWENGEALSLQERELLIEAGEYPEDDYQV